MPEKKELQPVKKKELQPVKKNVPQQVKKKETFDIESEDYELDGF